MDEALANLKSVPAFDNVLYFGCGIQSYVKFLSESQRGVNCIALCSSLSEVFSYPFTARTLSALWKVSGGPDEYEPSHAQFLALVKGCAGVLASSPFGAVAGRMLGLRAPENAVAPPPEQLARILDGLFKISLGNIESITVEGGPACAFIAGLAEWLFNFTVYVEDEDHTMIHLSATDPNTAQVKIRYRAYRSQDPRGITARSTYLLRDNEQLFLYSKGEMMDMVNFRVTRDQCLRQTFCATFIEDITATPEVVGHFFGSYARLLDGMAYRELDWMQDKLDLWPEFPRLEGSSGKALLESLTITFPELADMQSLGGLMLQGLSQSAADASQSVYANLMSLRDSCFCSYCTEPRYPNPREQWLCLPIAVFTVIEVARLLACVRNDNGLLPTCRGMRSIYSACFSRLDYSLRKERPERVFSGCYSLVRDRVTVTKVLALFSTAGLYDRKDIGNDKTALADCGICVYQESLRGISDSPDHLGMVNVLPGYIGYGARQYDFLIDPPGTPQASSAAEHWTTTDSFSTQAPSSSNEPSCTGTTPPTEPFVRHAKLKIKALFQECPGGGAVFFYQLMDASTSFSSTIFPGAITEITLQNLGKVRCECSNRLLQRNLPFNDRCKFVTSGWIHREEASQGSGAGDGTASYERDTTDDRDPTGDRVVTGDRNLTEDRNPREDRETTEEVEEPPSQKPDESSPESWDESIIIWPREDGWSRAVVLSINGVVDHNDPKYVQVYPRENAYLRRNECLRCSIQSALFRQKARWSKGRIHIL